MIDKMEIKLRNGRWLINGKCYQDLYSYEKIFFDEFLIAMRTIKSSKKSNN